MGVYSSSFVVEPKSRTSVSSHPSKANWITEHAISTELSIAEVERLWLRFQQLGANKDGVLTSEALSSPKLTSDVFIKNILKYFKSSNGTITFESFLKALKWCEGQELQVKARGIFQMLNNGNPIPKDMMQKIMMRVYPTESEAEIRRITDLLFQLVDPSKKGHIDESGFAHAITSLPRASTQAILNFHILPEQMRANVHQNLPEFSSQAGFVSSTPFESQVPSDAILKEVAEKIHRKDWDLVANRLGLFSEDIKTIRLNHPNSSYSQAYQMLLDWKLRDGDNATAAKLERVLRNSGMVEASLILSP